MYIERGKRLLSKVWTDARRSRCETDQDGIQCRHEALECDAHVSRFECRGGKDPFPTVDKTLFASSSSDLDHHHPLTCKSCQQHLSGHSLASRLSFCVSAVLKPHNTLLTRPTTFLHASTRPRPSLLVNGVPWPRYFSNTSFTRTSRVLKMLRKRFGGALFSVSHLFVPYMLFANHLTAIATLYLITHRH